MARDCVVLGCRESSGSGARSEQAVEPAARAADRALRRAVAESQSLVTWALEALEHAVALAARVLRHRGRLELGDDGGAPELLLGSDSRLVGRCDLDIRCRGLGRGRPPRPGLRRSLSVRAL